MNHQWVLDYPRVLKVLLRRAVCVLSLVITSNILDLT